MKINLKHLAAIRCVILLITFLSMSSSSIAQKFNDGDKGAIRMLVFNIAMDELYDSMQNILEIKKQITQFKITNQKKLKMLEYVGINENLAINLLDAAKVLDSTIRLALLIDSDKEVEKLQKKYTYVSKICLNMPSVLISEWYDDDVLKSRIQMSEGYAIEVGASRTIQAAVVDLIKKTNALGRKYNSMCADVQNIKNW